MIHSGPSAGYLLFPERAPVSLRRFSAEEHETERQVAQAFGRYPRSRPTPYEIPFYPFVHTNPYTRCQWPVRVRFSLGFNPFSE